MAMTSATRGVRSEINVTPLVDVVLVLLIIFMVVIPILQLGYPVALPADGGPRTTQQLVVRLARDGRVFVGAEEVPSARFPARLRELVGDGGRRMVFLAADGELPYGAVVDFMDVCRHSGAEKIGVVFAELEPADG